MGGYKGVARKWGSRLIDFIVNIRASKISNIIPKPLKRLFYQILPKQSLEQKTWEAKCRKKVESAKAIPHRVPITLGIIRDSMYRYGNYEVACLELGVPYKLVDITCSAWIKQIKDSGCDAFLVWPPYINTLNKQIFDERLRTIVYDLKKTIFPSYESIWLYESKRRTADWLSVNNIPHPMTYVFFDRNEALDFLESAKLPLVFKTDLGSEASGVEIIRDKKRGKRLINLCFGAGYLRKHCIWKDRARDYILFQEYIPDAIEWRIERIGNSFFGHQKGKKGDFHSGTKVMLWERPPIRLLDFCRDVTEIGSFMSMDLDILETKDGRYLVSELQAVFGAPEFAQMYIDGKPGRFVFDKHSNAWQFEEGDFCRNYLCNLRIETLLKQIGHGPIK